MRYLETAVLADLKKKMVLISGPRQSGKTTLSKRLLKDQFSGDYLNWDQVKDRKKILRQEWSDDLELLVLDEIHKKPNWKNFLKGIYDTKPDALSLLVTGSARLEYFQKSGDSMFGRYHAWRLHPFCLGEDPLKLPAKDRFSRFLERGGFPVPYLAESADEAQRWRKQRWSVLLREDLRDLESIRNVLQLELLAELLKECASGMISYSNLAEDVQIAPKTAKSWVTALEKLYLVFLVHPYTASLKRSISKTPKLYFTDPGDLLEQSEGVRIENAVALNLLKRIHYIEDAYGDAIGLHYVRDKEGREVDFLVTLRRKPIALIEVKKSPQDHSGSLAYFRERLKVPTAILLHADSGAKSWTKNGIRHESIQAFFDQPLYQREFWTT